MGRPCAPATNSLSAVTIEHEKSRDVFSTVDRPVRNSVLLISRTIASSRFASTARRTRSNSARSPARVAATLCAIIPPNVDQEVAGDRDCRYRTGWDDDCGRRLLDHG